MKRIMFWTSILVMLALVGCSFNLPSLPGQGGGAPKATDNIKATDDTVQTQVVQMLTTMPTSTSAQGAATATQQLATLTQPAPTNTQPAATSTLAATATPAPSATAAPTNTKAPTAVPPTPTNAPAGPTATPNPNDPRVKLGDPDATDPMDDASGFIWPTGSDEFTSADFTNGSMVLTSINKVDGWRMANPTGSDFKNIYLEATFSTKACTGADHYGLIVRVPDIKSPDQGYLFGFTCDGRYSLRRWDGKAGAQGDMKFLVDWTASPAINAGANKTNRIGIMLVNGRILMYANGKLLKEASDTKFSTGYFGVFIGPDSSQKTKNLTVTIDQMSYWENPQP